MRKFARTVAVILLAAFFVQTAHAEEGGEGFEYHSPEAIQKILEQIAKQNKDVARIHTLGATPGGRDLILVEIGSKADAPAILVIANMEGNSPLASEAALELARFLAGVWKEELDSRRWYIVPLGNPDGCQSFFEKPLLERFVNEKPFNDDKDDATDEDGPEDLNSDGYITVMRQAYPEGKWMPVEGNPVLMKKAEGAKGEKGIYRLFSEGIDNDGDGKLNEDPPGGVNPGRNFPHAFEHHAKTNGPWAASETESRAILRFAFDHPEIAMVIVFGRGNNLKEVPGSSRKQEAAQEKYKVPERWARRMGLDPDTEYELKVLVELAREATGYREMTEDMVLQFLGAGAAVNPDRRDLPYWKEVSKRYNDYIKNVGLDTERLAPAGPPPGSVEEWAYFQYGVPAFSIDFWTLPVKKKEESKDEAALTPEAVEKMSNEEFIALGEDKIAEFLKENNAPAQFSADRLIKGLEGGMLDTKRIAGFMKRAKKQEESGGVDETDQALFDFDPGAYIKWQPYDHPTLGAVEIGGKVPFSAFAPPADSVPALIEKQLPFVRKLAGLLPAVTIDRVEVKRRGADVWHVKAWVANEGFLPYPTYQGERCKRPTPVAFSIDGKSMELLEGRKRKVLRLLDGSGGAGEASWLIRAKEGSTVTLEASSFSAGHDKTTVTLEEGGGSR